jgi:hypothetical protein
MVSSVDVVRNEFGWLFEPFNSWLEMNKVILHAYFVSGVTAGKLFWPRSHLILTMMCGLQFWFVWIMVEASLVEETLVLVQLVTFCNAWGCHCLQSNTPSWNN